MYRNARRQPTNNIPASASAAPLLLERDSHALSRNGGQREEGAGWRSQEFGGRGSAETEGGRVGEGVPEGGEEWEALDGSRGGRGGGFPKE